jgi:hypothetical protein
MNVKNPIRKFFNYGYAKKEMVPWLYSQGHSNTFIYRSISK